MGSFSILPGLPASGPPALNFCVRRGAEGLVVQFTKSGGNTWIGNFGPGLTVGISEIFSFEGRGPKVVISSSNAYIVDVESESARLLSGTITSAHYNSKRDLVLLEDCGLKFKAVNSRGDIVWESERLAWDGFRNVAYGPDEIEGEAYAPWNPPFDWKSFSVNMDTGSHTGGNYEISANRLSNDPRDPTA